MNDQMAINRIKQNALKGQMEALRAVMTLETITPTGPNKKDITRLKKKAITRLRNLAKGFKEVQQDIHSIETE